VLTAVSWPGGAGADEQGNNAAPAEQRPAEPAAGGSQRKSAGDASGAPAPCRRRRSHTGGGAAGGSPPAPKVDHLGLIATYDELGGGGSDSPESQTPRSPHDNPEWRAPSRCSGQRLRVPCDAVAWRCCVLTLCGDKVLPRKPQPARRMLQRPPPLASRTRRSTVPRPHPTNPPWQEGVWRGRG
jgi:hypothetical protein